MNLRTAMAARIRAGETDKGIARALGVAPATVARTRANLHIPPHSNRYTLTRDQMWNTYATTVEAGHVRWDGPRNHAGTPVMKLHQITYTARSEAFRRRYGRDPIGYVLPVCDYRWCVADDHVADRPMRDRLTTLTHAVLGGRS